MNAKPCPRLPCISAGDCIGLFSPSGPIRNRAKVDAGIDILHELGFRTKYLHNWQNGHDYLAADDFARTEEIHALLADSEISALMAIRGGYGCLRMIEKLDMDLVRSFPKPIVGFSDLTVLLNTISNQAGIVTIHGPVVSSLAGTSRESIATLFSFLTGHAPGHYCLNGIEILRTGRSRGILRGGNLATIVHLMGTPWEVPLHNTLLLLEDTGEPLYRIDRMLTQLYYSGKMKTLSGILLGTFDTGQDKGDERELQKQVGKRVLELTADFAYPVWGGFPSGHLQDNYAIPIGMEATMDSDAAKLFFHTL